MKTNRNHIVGLFLAHACVLGLATLAVSAQETQQDKKQERPPAKENEQRLEQIEKQLQDLTKAVKELKGNQRREASEKTLPPAASVLVEVSAADALVAARRSHPARIVLFSRWTVRSSRKTSASNPIRSCPTRS